MRWLDQKNRRPEYLLTLATAVGEWNLREGYDLNGYLNHADFFNIMTYAPVALSMVCSPINDVRWWTTENSDESVRGQSEKSAKLINGFYPVCDPDDPGFSCCGAAGYCGSEEEYCGCETCVDYRKNPMDIVKEPVKPSRAVQWYSMSDEDGKRGRCGKDVPLLNGKVFILRQL
ncbi:hypothetical protein CAEBREN_31541 [Caenorhabditis brenneri]|uniref:Chitin-binding type-1 domain-containing protein n=1 Tax=Caenorhabditis brenneri TaxID=135651 RepID=G0PKP8_CAEBE|nr:hypothetical protein CAEBREN_31541 [Caenorhabditis brenneri]